MVEKAQVFFAFSTSLLLVGLAPDLDPSFEKLYGYLNDDVMRRRASVGLALELCGARVTDGWARSRLASSAPLISGGLVSVEDSDRPVLGRPLVSMYCPPHPWLRCVPGRAIPSAAPLAGTLPIPI